MAATLASAIGAIYWLPSWEVGRGFFPAPLDDVYIHFDFARSLGKGHPFEWIPGQGYSSGETSPLYAVLLAVGWVFGFRGRALGLWAALLALGSVASLLLSVRRLVRSSTRPSLAWLVALVPLSIGIVDWALFSGMEVAVFVAALGRALEALARVRDPISRGGPTREALQWRLGAWGAALCLLRPEAGVIVAVLALGAARGAGRRSAVAAIFRASMFGVVATAAVLGANFLATGDARSAGAQLKLLSSNPYLSDEDRARVFVENLVTFWVKVVRGELSIFPGLVVVLPVLAVVAMLRREHRVTASAALLSAALWTLLVSWNGNAPHHNFRYYAPALVLLGIAASLGLATIARISGRTGPALASVLGTMAIALLASRMPAQVRHYRSASANIRDQHIEVGTRIARLPQDARVLLGDAGAIPYVSNRSAIDALGLGGYLGVPFARAAVHGEAATIELIERLDPGLRPTHFALYPNWFGNLTSHFGVEIDRVTIEGNVICGGPTKVIYRADWSTLGGLHASQRRVVDSVDVADVIDEGAHHYLPPLPHGGWTTLDVLSDELDTKRFDGGRTIPDHAQESFVVNHSAAGPLTLRVRIDRGARGIVLRHGGQERELTLEPVRDGAWRSATVSIENVREGDLLTLEARGGEYRNYHLWLERPGTADL